jgi:hypothetical protein
MYKRMNKSARLVHAILSLPEAGKIGADNLAAITLNMYVALYGGHLRKL